MEYYPNNMENISSRTEFRKTEILRSNTINSISMNNTTIMPVINKPIQNFTTLKTTGILPPTSMTTLLSPGSINTKNTLQKHQGSPKMNFVGQNINPMVQTELKPTESQRDHERRIRREIANSNERRRMQSINAGFKSLKTILPHGDDEKLSKAAILQQTSEYILQLEADKIKLFNHNEKLRRAFSDCKCNSPKHRAIMAEINDKDEGIGSPLEEDFEDIRRSMLDVRKQLDKERRMRMVLEEQVRKLESELYPEKIKEITQNIADKSVVNTKPAISTLVMPSGTITTSMGQQKFSAPVSADNIQSVSVPAPNIQSLPVSTENIQSLPVSNGNIQSLPVSTGTIQSLPVLAGNIQSFQVSAGNTQSLPVSTGNVQSVQVQPMQITSQKVITDSPNINPKLQMTSPQLQANINPDFVQTNVQNAANFQVKQQTHPQVAKSSQPLKKRPVEVAPQDTYQPQAKVPKMTVMYSNIVPTAYTCPTQQQQQQAGGFPTTVQHQVVQPQILTTNQTSFVVNATATFPISPNATQYNTVIMSPQVSTTLTHVKQEVQTFRANTEHVIATTTNLGPSSPKAFVESQSTTQLTPITTTPMVGSHATVGVSSVDQTTNRMPTLVQYPTAVIQQGNDSSVILTPVLNEVGSSSPILGITDREITLNQLNTVGYTIPMTVQNIIVPSQPVSSPKSCVYIPPKEPSILQSQSHNQATASDRCINTFPQDGAINSVRNEETKQKEKVQPVVIHNENIFTISTSKSEEVAPIILEESVPDKESSDVEIETTEECVPNTDTSSESECSIGPPHTRRNLDAIVLAIDHIEQQERRNSQDISTEENPSS